MRTTYGDLWQCSGFLVVPTNLCVRADGMAVMGRGIALEACRRFPGLAAWYGEALRTGRRGLEVYQRLVLFPTKDDWRQPADLSLIEAGAGQLAAHPRVTDNVYMPLVGCGNGRLEAAKVVPILQRLLPDDCFALVLPSHWAGRLPTPACVRAMSRIAREGRARARP